MDWMYGAIMAVVLGLAGWCLFFLELASAKRTAKAQDDQIDRLEREHDDLADDLHKVTTERKKWKERAFEVKDERDLASRQRILLKKQKDAS